MAYNKEAYNIIEEALEVLKAKSDYAYPKMVGYLQAGFDSVEDAKLILKLAKETKGDK